MLQFFKTLYLKGIFQNKMLAKAFPFKGRPVLLLSHSRSGSSWIGKVLSLSPDIAYMREPITQAFIQKLNYRGPVYKPEKKQLHESLTKFTDQTFNGIPPIIDVIRNKSDFYPFRRYKRTLLIKEVKPLAANFIIGCHSPKTVVLIRHPAAVADSYIRLGWRQDSFEAFGKRYGDRMQNAVSSGKKTTFKMIQYEKMAENPKHGFLDLFSFLEVKEPPKFDQIVNKYCKNQNNNNEKWKPYETRRSSAYEANKWKHNLDNDIIKAVKEGYMRSGFKYYRNEECWQL